MSGSMIVLLAALLAVGGCCPSAQPSSPQRLVGIGYQTWFPPQPWSRTFDEPLLGFYRSDDPKVIRQHAEWLGQAGVDFIWIDWSNNIQAGPARSDLLQIEQATRVVFDEYLRLDRRPRISIFLGIDGKAAFVADGSLSRKADQVWREYAGNPTYQPLVQTYLGKPLLVIFVGCPSPFGDRLPTWDDPRFTVRWMSGFLGSQNGMTAADGRSLRGYWSWFERWPNSYSMQAGRCEAMTVNAGWPGEAGWEAPDAVGRRDGQTFERHWQRVRELGPRIVLVNSWNEWVLGEEHSPELSNDLEPSRTLGMRYLELLGEQIRRYKTMPQPKAPPTDS